MYFKFLYETNIKFKIIKDKTSKKFNINIIHEIDKNHYK